ncbi:MAG: hypothetical protein ACPGWR_12645 [Ardenticatenaceae bacterium]
MNRTLRLESLSRARNQLSMVYGFDGLRFETSYWYNDVDLIALEAKYGQFFMDKVYFHIMAFEANKLVSLRPDYIDLGPFASFHTPQFERLWLKIVDGVWSQWRYEHNFFDYAGPKFMSEPIERVPQTTTVEPQSVEVLSFCGGGKDSLVTMKLLERAAIPHASLGYSHSIYGSARHQHQLIDGLLDHGPAVKRHQIFMYDSFVDAPVLELMPELGVHEILAAETPSSLFAALPIVLQHGYRYLALGHEHSANVGNLIWEMTGEDVNHQWGKSLEAEILLDEYLQSEFVSNCTYFSLLQPLYDVLIFNLLRRDSDAVAATHSCNIHKPWCGKCPKCAYVWLNYMAYLDPQLVNSIFKVNLFDLAENQRWFYQMLGLAEHTPFECIGQIAEARLAFELCKRKGLTGQAMEMYKREFPALDIKPIIEKYLRIHHQQARIPPAMMANILPQMQGAARQALEYIKTLASADARF